MLAWTLIVVLTAPLFGISEVSGQTIRGRASAAGSRSVAGAQIFFRTSQGFSQTGVTTGHPTHSSVRRTVPPRRVAPGVAFVTPVAPAFHHFGRPFVHPVFPRHRRVLIIEVPGAIDATSITRVGPGVTYLDPSTAGRVPEPISRRAPDQPAPFDPTPQEVVERLLALAAVKRGDVPYDLGSGDGRILIAAAKIYGVKAVGFEIDPGLVKLARENVRKEGIEELVEIRQQDFLTADLSAASIITLYLSNDGNLAVKPKLMRELKPGARVVSYTFDMGDWAPKIAETYRDAGGDSHLLYFWQISEPVASTANAFPIQ
jgi:precorrin-6B methylase 2